MPVIRRQLHENTEPPNVVVRGFNVRRAATYAGVSVWQIRQWLRAGDLKAARIGKKDLIDKDVLDLFLDKLFEASSQTC
jgi:excisionase family DNA binding protein